MLYTIKKNTTQFSIVFQATNESLLPVDDMTASGLTMRYRREGASPVTISLTSLTSASDSWTSGGFISLGGGWYRLDLPDAAVADGATGVLVFGSKAGHVIHGTYIQLVSYDPLDSVRLGITALPNANAEAAGGLITRGTLVGQMDVSSGAVRADLRMILGSDTAGTNAHKFFTNGGHGPFLAKVTITDTSLYGTVKTLGVSSSFTTDSLKGALAIFRSPSGSLKGCRIISSNASTFLTFAESLSGSSAPAVNDLIEIVASRVGNSSLEEGTIGASQLAASCLTPEAFSGSTGLKPIRQGTCQGATTNTITLDSSASSNTDFYKNNLLILFQQGDEGDPASVGQTRVISAYNGTTKVATLDRDWEIIPTSGDKFVIVPYGPTFSGEVTLADGAITSSKFASNAIDDNAWGVTGASLDDLYAGSQLESDISNLASAVDLATAQEILDKLNDTLELDSGTWRFTSAALALAGSAGLTAEAVRDAILNRVLPGNHDTPNSVGYYFQNIPDSLSHDNLRTQVTTALSNYTAPTLSQLEDRTLPSASYATASALSTAQSTLSKVESTLESAGGGVFRFTVTALSQAPVGDLTAGEIANAVVSHADMSSRLTKIDNIDANVTALGGPAPDVTIDV